MLDVKSFRELVLPLIEQEEKRCRKERYKLTEQYNITEAKQRNKLKPHWKLDARLILLEKKIENLAESKEIIELIEDLPESIWHFFKLKKQTIKSR